MIAYVIWFAVSMLVLAYMLLDFFINVRQGPLDQRLMYLMGVYGAIVKLYFIHACLELSWPHGTWLAALILFDCGLLFGLNKIRPVGRVLHFG